MSADKHLICVTRKLPETTEHRLGELFQVELNPTDRPLKTAEIADLMSRADVLVPTVTDVIDEKLIRNAGPKLKLIANYGMGFDHIDMPAAIEAGITVTNTPDVLTQDTADMVMALILAVPRRVVEGAVRLREDHKNWNGWSPTWMNGHRLGGKKLGIVGLGRIGQAVARRAKTFGLEINYHNRRRASSHIEKELQAAYWESLDQMLASMDIVSINCPSTPATYHLLSSRRLRLLKSTAYIVNTARGDVIDERALIDLLENGRISGAGLDVFENEPAVNPKLLHMPNVVALPHMGSATIEARQDTGDAVIINIKTFLDGHTPPGRILLRDEQENESSF